MAISGDNFQTVHQTMCFDIVRLSKGQEKVTVDDVLCAIAPSSAHIKKEDKEAHNLTLIMREILSFTMIHKRNYLAMNRDELTQVLKEEWLSGVNEEKKREIVSEFKLIKSIDVEGVVTLNEKLVAAYDRIIDGKHTELEFGTGSVATKKKERRKRGVEIHVDVAKYGDKYNAILQQYKEILASNPDKAIWNEKYKWDFMEQCKGKSMEDIVMLFCQGKDWNIIGWRTRDDLKRLMNNQKDQLMQGVKNLCGGDGTLSDRCIDFIEFTRGLDHRLDERLISGLLTAQDNNQYTFYLYTVYSNLCDYLDEPRCSTGDCYEHFLRLVEPLETLIEADEDLHKELKLCFGDTTTILSLAQNVIWCLFYV